MKRFSVSSSQSQMIYNIFLTLFFKLVWCIQTFVAIKIRFI